MSEPKLEQNPTHGGNADVRLHLTSMIEPPGINPEDVPDHFQKKIVGLIQDFRTKAYMAGLAMVIEPEVEMVWANSEDGYCASCAFCREITNGPSPSGPTAGINCTSLEMAKMQRDQCQDEFAVQEEYVNLFRIEEVAGRGQTCDFWQSRSNITDELLKERCTYCGERFKLDDGLDIKATREGETIYWWHAICLDRCETPRIFLHVSGGLIQSAYSDIPIVPIVIDDDVHEESDDDFVGEIELAAVGSEKVSLQVATMIDIMDNERSGVER